MEFWPVGKTTYDECYFDFAFGSVLLPTEYITEVVSITASIGGMTFGTGVINDAPVTYPGNVIARTGTAIQTFVTGGVIPEGLAFLAVPVTIRFKTNLTEKFERTVVLYLNDNPDASSVCV